MTCLETFMGKCLNMIQLSEQVEMQGKQSQHAPLIASLGYAADSFSILVWQLSTCTNKCKQNHGFSACVPFDTAVLATCNFKPCIFPKLCGSKCRFQVHKADKLIYTMVGSEEATHQQCLGHHPQHKSQKKLMVIVDTAEQKYLVTGAPLPLNRHWLQNAS